MIDGPETITIRAGAARRNPRMIRGYLSSTAYSLPTRAPTGGSAGAAGSAAALLCAMALFTAAMPALAALAH